METGREVAISYTISKDVALATCPACSAAGTSPGVTPTILPPHAEQPFRRIHAIGYSASSRPTNTG
jgi:hypothetical protein